MELRITLIVVIITASFQLVTPVPQNYGQVPYYNNNNNHNNYNNNQMKYPNKYHTGTQYSNNQAHPTYSLFPNDWMGNYFMSQYHPLMKFTSSMYKTNPGTVTIIYCVMWILAIIGIVFIADGIMGNKDMGYRFNRGIGSLDLRQAWTFLENLEKNSFDFFEDPKERKGKKS